MVTLRQHRLDVRESFRPSLGRCEGMWLRRRRRALPLLQRIQRRQPAAASGGLSTRRESGRRLNASARRAWEKRPLPRLTRRTPVSGGDRDAWRGSIPWLARHRAVRARQARRHEVDQGGVYRAELDMETLVWTRGRSFPLSRLETRLRCPMCGSRRAVDLHRAARSADGARRKIGAEVKSVTPWVTAARRTY